eukprot:161783_1
MATYSICLWLGILGACMFHIPIWLFVAATSFNMVRSFAYDINMFAYTLSSQSPDFKLCGVSSDNFPPMPRSAIEFSPDSSTLYPNFCPDQQLFNDKRQTSERKHSNSVDSASPAPVKNITIIMICTIMASIVYCKLISHSTSLPLFLSGALLVIIQISMTNSMQMFIFNDTNAPPSTLRCGLQDDCEIMCQAKNVCQDTTFYFYNNNVTFTCNNQASCMRATIYVVNVTSFHLISNGQWGFHQAHLWTSGNNQNISLTCAGCPGCRYSCQANTLHIGRGDNIEIACKWI